MRAARPRHLRARWVAVAAIAAALAFPTPAAAAPGDDSEPDLVTLLDGFADLWTSDGTNDLHGKVLDGATLARNDRVVVWINNNATVAQQFSALQTSEYDQSGSTYDESITVAPGLGAVLAPLYVQGRQNGSLPLTSAVISSEGGSSGDYVSGVGTAKDTYSYPRPFLASDPAQPPANEPCTGGQDGASLQANRVGRPYADAVGNLDIVQVAATVDTTDEFADADVPLDPGYAGLCSAGSFPSGHSTTAYQSGITLATLLPELGPEILARASEQANNRLVLGVHYPLDLMGGRISGEAGIAARWSDATYREQVLEPARAELITYLEDQCGDLLTACAARGTAYQDDPYGGLALPGGTAQIVTDRPSAVAVFTERLTYGFAPVGTVGLAPSVPAGAENLLLTTFPTLDDAQRISVLAQTQLASGYALDQSGPGGGSWQRLDLAAAMSATVQLNADASVTVLATGGHAQVLPHTPPTTSTTETSTTGTSTTGTSTTGTSTNGTTSVASTSTSPSTTQTTTTQESTLTTAPTTVISTQIVVLPARTAAAPAGAAPADGAGAGGPPGSTAGELAATGVAPAATVWTGLAALSVGGGLLVLGGVGHRRTGVRREH